MSGKLYLCATPIGNLEDITLRVLRTLKEVDLIAAEDTRNSIKLLNHFDIKTPMTSYHEYNKIDKAYVLISKMQEGQNIALITDAGTPGISDPGEELAAMCYEAGIEVTSLPGPAACITALTLSGLPTRRFAFEAFLPADKKERKLILEELKNETRTIILYEAPHRLVRTLEELKETLGNRRMTLCRELTKRHETAFHTTIEELILYYQTEKPLGESVQYFSHPQLTGYFFRMYTRCFPYHWLLVCTLPKRYMSEIYNLAAHHKFDAALNQLLLPSVLMLLWKKYVQFFLFYTL